MNILLLGSGGREHALAIALAKSPLMKKLYCTPGNPGIFNVAEKADVSASDNNAVKAFCAEKNIDLLVVGPEQPLADGIADIFEGTNTAVFGPSKMAAQLESSKDFAKRIMSKYNVPTAAFKTFTADEATAAHEYINAHTLPIVLKADGLAGGKGVVIAMTHKEANDSLDEIFSGVFGDLAGSRVVIEEFMAGEEASIFAVCDGKDYITLSPAQDHKRIGEGDTGKNTGGMGAYSPAPVVNDEILAKTHKEIIEPMLAGMQKEGAPFIGCLYCGIMISNGQAKVVEFNVRFGDPETQVVLPLFKGDLAKLFLSAAQGNIDKTAYEGNIDKSATCVILASAGYPDSCEKGFEITGIAESENENLIVYQAGTKSENGKILSAGGRVLGVTAIENDLQTAVASAYKAVDTINFANKYFRKDIAHRALKN
jgi:phosphoribosylamine--glycine ligase